MFRENLAIFFKDFPLEMKRERDQTAEEVALGTLLLEWLRSGGTSRRRGGEDGYYSSKSYSRCGTRKARKIFEKGERDVFIAARVGGDQEEVERGKGEKR